MRLDYHTLLNLFDAVILLELLIIFSKNYQELILADYSSSGI